MSNQPSYPAGQAPGAPYPHPTTPDGLMQRHTREGVFEFLGGIVTRPATRAFVYIATATGAADLVMNDVRNADPAEYHTMTADVIAAPTITFLVSLALRKALPEKLRKFIPLVSMAVGAGITKGTEVGLFHTDTSPGDLAVLGLAAHLGDRVAERVSSRKPTPAPAQPAHIIPSPRPAETKRMRTPKPSVSGSTLTPRMRRQAVKDNLRREKRK